jgi:hypothetical protein
MNGVALALALVLFLVCVIEMRRKPPFIGGEEGVPWNIPILLWKHQTTILILSPNLLNRPKRGGMNHLEKVAPEGTH